MDHFLERQQIMSSFLCSDKTFETTYLYLLNTKIFEYLDTDYTLKQAIAELRDLNMHAVAGRYKEAVEKLDSLTFNTNLISPIDAHQCLKNIQCILYQCSEILPNGMKGNSTYIFKLFEHIAGVIACDIVKNTSAYKYATWDL